MKRIVEIDSLWFGNMVAYDRTSHGGGSGILFSSVYSGLLNDLNKTCLKNRFAEKQSQ